MARYLLNIPGKVSLRDMISMFRDAAREKGVAIGRIKATMIVTTFLEKLNKSGAMKQIPDDVEERAQFFYENLGRDGK